MSDIESLELRTVMQRFSESSTALEELQERLKSLDLAYEIQAESAASIRTSSNQFADLVATVRDVAKLLETASDTVRETLEGAKDFLQATDLSGLRQELAEQIGGLRTLVETELRAAGEEAAEKQAELDILKQRIATIPERQRKRAGL